MDYKVNFKTKTMEWKTKYNKLVEDLDLDNLLRPKLQDTATSSLVGDFIQFEFDLNENDKNGFYLFTYGYCMVIIPVYNLTDNQEYKLSAVLLNGEGGYSLRILTYRIHENKLIVYSKENIIPQNYVGYLFRVKLY